VPATNLTVKVRKLADGVSALDVQGDINAQAESTLMEAYGTASRAGARAIILNLSGLQYMNSGGIGLLVTLLIRVNRQQQRLLACGLSEHYRHIFELTRLSEAIALYPNEVAALRAAAAPARPGTLAV
jgi:anti-sigma B factor antagonist